jgi:hypothetical protein
MKPAGTRMFSRKAFGACRLWSEESSHGWLADVSSLHRRFSRHPARSLQAKTHFRISALTQATFMTSSLIDFLRRLFERLIGSSRGFIRETDLPWGF